MIANVKTEYEYGDIITKYDTVLGCLEQKRNEIAKEFGIFSDEYRENDKKINEAKQVTVADLIDFLEGIPQDLPVMHLRKDDTLEPLYSIVTMVQKGNTDGIAVNEPKNYIYF